MAHPSGGAGFGAPARFPTVNGGGRRGGNFAPGPGRPPTNMLQAYGYMGGKLPGMTYSRLPSGFGSRGEWAYVGTHPVNLAQAYQHMGGKLPIPPAGQQGAPGSGSGAGAGAGAGASPGIDPRDATYYQNVSQNEFKTNNELNALNLQKSQGSTALQSALGNLRYQQPRDQLAMEQRANQAGALYSSPYAQQQGNLAHRYATQENTLETNYANLVDRLSAQQSAIEGGVPLYESGQYLGAAERAAAAAAKNPATGQPPAVPVPGAHPPGSPPPGSPPPGSPPAGSPPGGHGGTPPGYWNPAQQMAASQAAARRGGVGAAPKGMPAAGRILNFNGQHYRVSYDAAGQARFTRVGGGR